MRDAANLFGLVLKRLAGPLADGIPAEAWQQGGYFVLLLLFIGAFSAFLRALYTGVFVPIRDAVLKTASAMQDQSQVHTTVLSKVENTLAEVRETVVEVRDTLREQK